MLQRIMPVYPLDFLRSPFLYVTPYHQNLSFSIMNTYNLRYIVKRRDEHIYQKTNYFTAGEFAHLCKVNKQTLIYYERIGLFSPIYKDEKGYRYYSVSQYDFFSVIELLKEIGMPLKEIQHYMANKSPDRFIQL